MSCYESVLAELRDRFPGHAIDVPAESVLGECWIAHLKRESNHCLVVVVTGEFGRPLSDREIASVDSVQESCTAVESYWLYVEMAEEMQFTWECGN